VEDDRLLHVGAGGTLLNVLMASPTTMGFEIVTRLSYGMFTLAGSSLARWLNLTCSGYFIGDLDNRAHIDYLEGHYADEPDIVAGGKRFWERCKKLRAIHPNLWG
jgi:hypothetical protein